MLSLRLDLFGRTVLLLDLFPPPDRDGPAEESGPGAHSPVLDQQPQDELPAFGYAITP